MCPAHRTQTLDAIRAALKDGRPCRVVSTALIECGVDVSFPVVYRAEAGIDSVAQAGGRCNREWELPEGGVIYVFTPVDVPTPGGDMQRPLATPRPRSSSIWSRWIGPRTRLHRPGRMRIMP